MLDLNFYICFCSIRKKIFFFFWLKHYFPPEMLSQSKIRGGGGHLFRIVGAMSQSVYGKGCDKANGENCALNILYP